MRSLENGVLDLMDLVIVTGLSGAGKTAALNVLEDSGYLCVDNLPTPLIDELVHLLDDKPEVQKLALALDKRNRIFSTELYQTILDLKDRFQAKVLSMISALATAMSRQSSGW